jgi:hypothetical protein
MAPLGTDEEAAGTPLPGEVVAQARRQERRPVTSERREPDGAVIWFIAGIASLVVIGIVAIFALA